MNKTKYNIKNLFNGKLFLEAFKQIRIIGYTSLAMFITIGIFYPIMIFFNERDTYRTNYNHISLFDTDEFMCPLLALIFIVTPLMFIILFNFLTKRNSSDFFHSLPVKRSTLFITYSTAVLTWVTLLSVVYTAILLITTKFTLPLYVIDGSTIFYYIINVLISCILIISIFTIGISITGTLTSNIISSGAILIIPGFVVTILKYLVTDHSNTVAGTGHLFFNEYANMPFALITSLLGGENIPLYNLLTIGEHTFYTLGLAIIYLIIGIKLFISRPSETSSKSCKNRRIFLILKYGTCFLISLIIVGCIFSDNIDEIKELISEEFYSIIFVIVGVIACSFAFEAAYTKSVKKGLKSILCTPLIFIADIIVIIIMYTATQYYNNETFDKNNVDYIYVTNLFDAYSSLDNRQDDYYPDEYDSYYYEDYYYDDEYYYYQYEQSYVLQMLRDIKITDKYIVDYLVDIYNTDRANSKTQYHRVKVTFDSPLCDESRYVYLTTGELRHIGNKLKENRDFQDCFYNYPSIDDPIAIGHESTFPTQTKNLYASLISEYKKLSFDELVDIALENTSDNIVTDYIYVEQHINGHLLQYSLPICTSTPDTLLLSLNYENENNLDNTIKFLDYIENNIDSDNYRISGSASNLSSTNTEDTSLGYMPLKLDSNEDKKALIKLMKDYISSNTTFNKNILEDTKYYIARIHFVQTSDKDKNLETYGSYYITIPVDSPLIIKYDDHTDYTGYNLIEMYEDEFGATVYIYEDEYGNQYKETHYSN